MKEKKNRSRSEEEADTSAHVSGGGSPELDSSKRDGE